MSKRPARTVSTTDPLSTPAAPIKGLKGQKAHLPHKPCLACGRPMSWRKAWAKTWDSVRYCSDACRRRKGPVSGATA